MRKIKLFEDFTNEELKRIEDFDAVDKTDDVEETTDGEYELNQDDEDSMRDDDEDENDPDNQLEEAADPLVVTSKDIMRIQDIVRKAEGNASKAKKLAETMCKLITDKWKALRRARAAEREGEPDLADIFTHRAKELGALGA
jgi:hypothetical protein